MVLYCTQYRSNTLSKEKLFCSITNMAKKRKTAKKTTKKTAKKKAKKSSRRR